ALRVGLVPAFPAGPTGARTRPTFSLDTSLLAGTYERRAVRPRLPDCLPPGPAEAAAFGGAVLNLRQLAPKTRHSISVSAWHGPATMMTTRATTPSSTFVDDELPEQHAEGRGLHRVRMDCQEVIEIGRAHV